MANTKYNVELKPKNTIEIITDRIAELEQRRDGLIPRRHDEARLTERALLRGEIDGLRFALAMINASE